MDHEYGLALSALVVLTKDGKEIATAQIISFAPDGDGLFLQSVEPDRTEYWLFYFEAHQEVGALNTTPYLEEAGWYEVYPTDDEESGEECLGVIGPYQVEPVTQTIQ